MTTECNFNALEIKWISPMKMCICCLFPNRNTRVKWNEYTKKKIDSILLVSILIKMNWKREISRNKNKNNQAQLLMFKPENVLE